MLDILRSHLSESATPELLDSLEAAHDLFDRLGLEDYERSFEEILVIDDSPLGNEKDAVVATTELTLQLLGQILRQHGVVIHDHLQLAERTLLLAALQDLPDYDDPVLVLRTSELDGTPIEVFAELIALVTPEQPTEVMTMVDEVDYALIARLQELVRPRAEALSTPPATPQSLGLLRSYLSLFPQDRAEKLLACQMIHTQLPTGLEFSVYADLYGREFENLEADTAAEELLAIALISKEATRPQQVIEEHIEAYVSNLDKITRIRIKVAELLIQLNQRHEQT